MKKKATLCFARGTALILSKALPLACCIYAAWGTNVASADTPEQTERAHLAMGSKIVTIRAQAGLGGGQTGGAGRLAVAGEGWLGEHAGLGAFVSASAQGTLCFLCTTQNETSEAFGLMLAARTESRGNYGYFAVGGGYALGRQWTRSESLFYDTTLSDSEQHGALLNVSAGWLFHRGKLELGPMLAVDATTWGSFVATANVAVGLALP